MHLLHFFVFEDLIHSLSPGVIPTGSLTLKGLGDLGVHSTKDLRGLRRVWWGFLGVPEDDVDVAVFFDALLGKFLLPLSFSCVASQ